MSEIPSLIAQVNSGDSRSLARAITIVENELAGSDELLESISVRQIPLIGITGPPGAGKSSLVNSLIRFLLEKNYRIGVITVDPTSPFNFGSLLGDRIRMADHFTHPNVFIRSLASRGSLGGLSDKIIEITDVMKSAPFDFLFVETVGVGQSEVEIAGLADVTVVVLVPEAGDEVQTMKAGLMEIADIFVVNKADHPDADRFVQNLKTLAHSRMNSDWQIPVVKTVATRGDGVEELLNQIENYSATGLKHSRKTLLLAEKVWKMIVKDRMKNVDRKKLAEDVRLASGNAGFNIYRFAKLFSESNR